MVRRFQCYWRLQWYSGDLFQALLCTPSVQTFNLSSRDAHAQACRPFGASWASLWALSPSLSVNKLFHPLSPPGIYSILTDTSCSHHLSLAISFPSPLSKSVSPTPFPSQSPSFPFLHSFSSFLLDIPCPGPLSLPCLFPSLRSFASTPGALPQTAYPYLLTSCPLHFNQLSPACWHQSQVDRECPKVPVQTAVFFSKLSKNMDRVN